MSFYSHDYVKCANCATLRPTTAMDLPTHSKCADATWCDEVKRGVRLPQGPRPLETFAEIFEQLQNELPNPSITISVTGDPAEIGRAVKKAFRKQAIKRAARARR